MDTNNNNQDDLKITPEEQKFDEEMTQEVKDDELRAKIAQDLGIEADDEPDLLDKLLAREKLNREKLSGAIKQKINWRTKALDTSKKPDGGGKPDDGADKNKGTLTQEDMDRLLDERLAERDLKEMALPEDIEKEVKDLAKLRGISVKEAVKLPYIVSRLDEIEKQNKINNASPKRDSKGSIKLTDIDYSKSLNPADFDLNSEDGRKAWKEARAKRDEWLKNNSGK